MWKLIPNNVAVYLRDIFFSVGLVWAAAPRWTVSWLLLLVIQGFLPIISLYLTRLLVDSLTIALSTDARQADISLSLFYTVIMGATVILAQVLNHVAEVVRTAQVEYVKDHIDALLQQKTTTLDLAFFESPSHLDLLYRASSEINTSPLILLENGGSFLQNVITLIGIAALLTSYSFWLPLLLLIGALPILFVVLKSNRRNHEWWVKTTTQRRWLQYYSTLMVHQIVAAELRLFNLGPSFRAIYQQLRGELRRTRLQLVKNQAASRIGTSMIGTVILALAMGWMGWLTLLERLTLGDLALFYQAFNRGQGVMSTLSGNVGRIYDNLRHIGHLRDFLALDSQITSPPQPQQFPYPLVKEIRFDKVTFRYPNSERAVFQDFNFTIPVGKTIAIVGANGSGKTTMLKLLCRFYDPESGKITVDGVDIRHIAVDDFRQHLTVMFQVPFPYIATAANNIGYGQGLDALDFDQIIDSAKRAGAHDFIMRLPQGYETLLGKLFASGTELSGGEWQRLALARSFLRQAPIMILDEPTSSIDSWGELDWYKRVRGGEEERTIIIITHRLIIAKQADIIHVMDSGKIVESGSHEELLALGGRYANSWHAQMQQTSTEDGINLDELPVAVAPA